MASQDLPSLVRPSEEEEEESWSSSPSQNKRACSAFDRLVNWIVSQDGGYVHPSIRMRQMRMAEEDDDDEIDRFLFVKKRKSSADDDEGDSEGGGVVIPKGEDVFRIPHSLLVTESNIPLDFVGIQCLDSILSSPSSADCGVLPELNLPRQDLLLAWYLSSNPPRIRPYLSSLPNADVYEEKLPRCWPEDTLRQLLRGSQLLERVERQKKQVQDDYDTLSKALDRASSPPSSSCSGLPSMPAFREFSHNLAVVTSRAFEGMEGFQVIGGRPSDVALIPLLDLCNHRRRGSSYSSTSSKSSSNLSYRFDADAKVILVQSSTDLMTGDQLTITYGAKGNSQLLLNYAFCLPNNLEPDGSSNTVYELAVPAVRLPSPPPSLVRPINRTVLLPLRAGPKSYSYGGFVKALEYFLLHAHSHQPEEEEEQVVVLAESPSAAIATNGQSEHEKCCNGSSRDQEGDEMEAFLNECDDEQDQNDDDDDEDSVCYLATGDQEIRLSEEELEEEEEVSSSYDIETVESELSALNGFQTCLETARSKYKLSGDDLAQALMPGEDPSVFAGRRRDRAATSKRYHTALLIQSELRTIYFFELAIHRLRHALDKHGAISNSSSPLPAPPETTSSAPPAHPPPPVWMTLEDAELIHSQVEELIIVFLCIRHPNLQAS